MSLARKAVVAGLFTLLLATTGAAQEKLPELMPGVEPAHVMILGTFHFHNPNADYAQFEGIDVLRPERQREIEQIADALAAFRPTRIAVERRLSEADTLDATYGRYRAGDFTLPRNETHQLGFRLAARLGHDRVHPIDYPGGMRIDSVLGYSQANDGTYAQRFQAFIGKIVPLMDRMQRERTIGESLRWMNTPEALLANQAGYVDMATVGAADGYIGARVVAGWYERNLHMFANLAAITQPGDRVLVIVGQGHAPILRDLVRDHPAMELVEPNDYLP